MFSPSSLMASLFGQNGEGIQPGLGQSGTQNSGDTQQNLQGPMSPTVQPTGPKVVQKVSGSSGGGGGGNHNNGGGGGGDGSGSGCLIAIAVVVVLVLLAMGS